MVEQQREAGPQIDWIRKQVDSGCYTFSEHIIRLCTSRVIDVAEIEDVLRRGEIVEYRRNAQKEIGSLVRGCTEGKRVSILCAKEVDDTLGLLVGYVSPAPPWIEDMEGRIEESAMDAKRRRCFFCGGDIKPIVVGNFDYRLDGELFVVKNVPAGLCLTCGEKYVESNVAREINTRVKRGEYSSEDKVRVVVYGGF